MFDTAESYAGGQSEIEMCVLHRIHAVTGSCVLTRTAQGSRHQRAELPPLGPDHHDEAVLGRQERTKRHGSLSQAVSNRLALLVHTSTPKITVRSIIEGTRESLQRLGLEYVDVIFAHRADHTGALPLSVSCIEIMTAFSCSPYGGGHSRVQLRGREGLRESISRVSTSLSMLSFPECRPCTGEPLSGLHKRSRRLIVCG